MSDWASETAELIERTVSNVRAKTVEPVTRGARMIVLGLLAAGFALTAISLLLLVLFRALVLAANALPGPDDNAWLAWFVLGLGLTAAGALLWNKRTPSKG